MLLIGKYLNMCWAVCLVIQLCPTLHDPMDHPPSLYLKKISKSQFPFYYVNISKIVLCPRNYVGH